MCVREREKEGERVLLVSPANGIMQHTPCGYLSEGHVLTDKDSPIKQIFAHSFDCSGVPDRVTSQHAAAAAKVSAHGRDQPTQIGPKSPRSFRRTPPNSNLPMSTQQPLVFFSPGHPAESAVGIHCNGSDLCQNRSDRPISQKHLFLAVADTDSVGFCRGGRSTGTCRRSSGGGATSRTSANPNGTFHHQIPRKLSPFSQNPNPQSRTGLQPGY